MVVNCSIIMSSLNNIFLSGELKVYGGWNPIDEHKFNKAELNFVKSAVVADSEYGKSIKFTFITGQYAFIELDSSSESLEIGTPVDPAKVTIITLSKPGEKNIRRVKIDE